MRGHISKRSKNSWTIVLDLGRDPVMEKRKQQWVSVKGTKKNAERKLAELLHQLDTGGYVMPTKGTWESSWRDGSMTTHGPTLRPARQKPTAS